MPRCEGLPTGPCPVDANDRTVKNSQGDLFLCPSCDEARYPSTAKSRSSKNAKRASHKATTQSSHSASDSNIKCTGCDKMCSSTACLKCDICFDTFDQQCSTLPKDVFSTLLTIIQIQWVCYTCRSTCRTKPEQLHANLNTFTDKLVTCSTAVEHVQHDLPSIYRQCHPHLRISFRICLTFLILLRHVSIVSASSFYW